MKKEFHQVAWDTEIALAWQMILRLAVAEDLSHEGDWTTRSLVPEKVEGAAAVVARQTGVIAGLPAVQPTLDAIDPALRFTSQMDDGHLLQPGAIVGRISGPVRSMLSAERTLLNVLGRLSGIATLTRRYVDALAGTRARIYDTRKTTPGWRLLEKYAVRCGGGVNHRSGLFEAVLIKDNHLAFGADAAAGQARYSPGEAVAKARQYLAEQLGASAAQRIVEVEVDTLAQLDAVLPFQPDIVLLDNMTAGQLREAVARRDAMSPQVELEASGGVNLQTLRGIAESGVERISVGALTHSAVCLDLGLDWQ